MASLGSADIFTIKIILKLSLTKLANSNGNKCSMFSTGAEKDLCCHSTEMFYTPCITPSFSIVSKRLISQVHNFSGQDFLILLRDRSLFMVGGWHRRGIFFVAKILLTNH
jgi:hypothetical protein